ncbi:LuxR C-terminal-related transcriptional regulator [Saccharopolyspora sp. 5N708]|uniref:LuxR C-terminal-related transcriptional regulator n=1 Tax=Saccharopolyspora sp. 5N708 TaxID=3457424 RepID=UPI003FD6858F
MAALSVQRIRVAVCADADPITSTAMTAFLHGQRHIQPVPAQQVTEHDVLVLLVNRWSTDAMVNLRQIHQNTPTRVLLITDDFDARDLLTAIEYGLVGLLPRSTTTAAQLIDAVRSVHAAQAVLPRTLQGALLTQVNQLQRLLRPLGIGITGLDDRELDVLRLLADGFLTEEIAVKLNYSDRTVKKVVQRVVQKVDARNRSHAVAIALRAGVI